MISSDADAVFMRRALVLAEQGWGRVHPNPLVGAVLVRNGEIIAEGSHQEFGEFHAEAAAISVAGERAQGATLYVTLEPCAHHGKQPPCVTAVIRAGIARVVIASLDPNPVAQGGVATLRAAGIQVEVGLLGSEASRLNARFHHQFARMPRPLVAVKLAVSMDGKIADANGASRWISGETARNWVHRLRAGFGAIAVGATTAIADDVRLTVRGDVTPRVAPVRVIFDRSGRLPATHGILADAAGVPVYVLVGSEAAEAATPVSHAGAQVVVANSLEEGLAALAAAGVDSLLVEGGGELAGALRQQGLVDRIYQIQSPVWLGEGGRPAWGASGNMPIEDADRWHTVDRITLGDDTLIVMEP